MSARTSLSATPSNRSCLDRELEFHDVQLNDEKKADWNPKSNDHPRNWSIFWKFYVTVVVTWLEFYMTAVSTAGTATSKPAAKEYGISSTLSIFAFVTIYLLGQTIGGIFCSPISEVFGRRTIYGIGSALFCVSCIVTAAPKSLVAVFFGRFFQGIAAAIPATVAFGNFNDMFDSHSRVWVVYGYTSGGLSGLALGPIYSSYVTEYLGWRWVYYIATIVAGASVPLCVFMKESNADQILAAKVKKVKEKTDHDSLQVEGAEKHQITVSKFVQSSLYRPLEMLVAEPLVTFSAALCGIAFGLSYGLTESLTIVYTSRPFNFTQTSASLAFIAILLGFILNLLPRLYDDHLLKKFRRTKREVLPETKIRSFAVACPALAIGLWLFAWTIPPRVTAVPWPVSMIGLVLVGFAICDFSYVLFGYVADAYGEYAASAASAVSTTRTLMAAVFPLFTTQMYEGLGSNVATTILAAAATAFCFTPVLFLRFGGRLRHKSELAQDNEACVAQEENAHMREGDVEMKESCGSEARTESRLALSEAMEEEWKGEEVRPSCDRTKSGHTIGKAL